VDFSVCGRREAALHRLVVAKPRSGAAPARADPRKPKVTIPEEEELSRGSEKQWGESLIRAIIPTKSISQILGKDQQGGTFMNCILASDDN
jgi:hypothetical protein